MTAKLGIVVKCTDSGLRVWCQSPGSLLGGNVSLGSYVIFSHQLPYMFSEDNNVPQKEVVGFSNCESTRNCVWFILTLKIKNCINLPTNYYCHCIHSFLSSFFTW